MDAINFKITSTLLLGANAKLDDNWKKDCLSRSQNLVAILIKVDKVDEPRKRNLLRPYRRESSQHQEFEFNDIKTIARTSSAGTSTLTTNIVHSKGATVTIKYSDDMDID